MASLSPSPEIPQFETIFVVHLDTYIKNSTESNGKTKVKEVKSMKIKEVVFHISAPNYLDFLTTMLHGCRQQRRLCGNGKEDHFGESQKGQNLHRHEEY
jgi:hypothetical protein